MLFRIALWVAMVCAAGLSAIAQETRISERFFELANRHGLSSAEARSFARAEREASAVWEFLGRGKRPIRFEYASWPGGAGYEVREDRIRINLHPAARSSRSHFEGMWRRYQQVGSGSPSRVGFLAAWTVLQEDPYGREARRLAPLVERLGAEYLRSGKKLTPEVSRRAVQLVEETIRGVGEMKRVPSLHHRRLEAHLWKMGNYLADRRALWKAYRGGGRIRSEVAGAGRAALGYFVNSGLHALEDGNTQAMESAWGAVGQGSFWTSVGLYAGANRITDLVLDSRLITNRVLSRMPAFPRAALRAGLPLGLGMAAWGAASGTFEPARFALTTASMVLSGAGVDLVADAVLYPILFRQPAGWVGVTLYAAGKMGLAMYGGEKIEQGVRALPRIFAGAGGSRRAIGGPELTLLDRTNRRPVNHRFPAAGDAP